MKGASQARLFARLWGARGKAGLSIIYWKDPL
jgi:hypothetical protein